ncbi:hypothetical protein SSAG_06773, partial [Streptomyces sp. Mg1]
MPAGGAFPARESGGSPVPSAATPELPKPDITLPPLLPGLLPGLGLSAEDAAE